MQALLSSQPVPLDFGVVEHVPFVGLQVPLLQALFRNEQSTAVPVVQASVVVLHFSTPLQALWSSQSVSFVQPQAAVFTVHPPATSLQPSIVQAMPSLQTRAAPPHTPPVQASETVHAFPSLHAVVSALAGFEQMPVAGTHVPAV